VQLSPKVLACQRGHGRVGQESPEGRIFWCMPSYPTRFSRRALPTSVRRKSRAAATTGHRLGGGAHFQFYIDGGALIGKEGDTCLGILTEFGGAESQRIVRRPRGVRNPFPLRSL
jgi:hypothetical protein